MEKQKKIVYEEIDCDSLAEALAKDTEERKFCAYYEGVMQAACETYDTFHT